VLNVRPVYLYLHPLNPGPQDRVAKIYDLGNSVVLYFGLAATGVLAVRWVRAAMAAAVRRHVNTTASGSVSTPVRGAPQRWTWPAAFLVAAYLALWLPWGLSPRVMFFYHYLPAVPMLCIASGLLLASWLRNKRKWVRLSAWVVLGLAVAWFAFFFPLMTAIPLPSGWSNAAYDWIYHWR
jgi:dolichyl-phosphate-mannose--protein O-mannosyl transferase